MNIGQASFDFKANRITGPGGSLSVEPMVMEVLSVLVNNAGEVVTRDSLIDEVWGVGHGGDQRLSRAISVLRKSFEDVGLDLDNIKTVTKRGYMLVLEQGSENENTATDLDAGSTIVPDIPSAKTKSRSGLMLAIFGTVLALFASALFFKFGSGFFSPEPPLVIVMDSAHPARIYDEAVKEEGGTNADILSDILADLPIRTQKELISPSWHRHEAIAQFDPDLIVVHYSGFKQEDARGDRPQLRLLVKYFQGSDTEFLIYSRAGQDWLDHNTGVILEELYKEDPSLKDRVAVFPLLEYGEPHWKDQGPAQGIKLKIKDLLELE